MHNQKQRINLQDSTVSAIVKIAEGNPGAVTVIMHVGLEYARIDPDSVFSTAGALGIALMCDCQGWYGPKVWEVFKDVCGSDPVAFLGISRAEQLGLISDADQVTAEQVQGILEQVRERLPKFGSNL